MRALCKGRFFEPLIIQCTHGFHKKKATSCLAKSRLNNLFMYYHRISKSTEIRVHLVWPMAWPMVWHTDLQILEIIVNC